MYLKGLPLFVLISSGLLNAQVIPGRWEKLDRQPTGKQMIVTLKAGDRLECALKESGADYLTVITSTGSELTIAKSEVREIESQERIKDSLNNGALIGMGIGLGVVVALLAVAASGEGEVLASAKWGAPLLGIGAGLGVGMAIDASQQRTEVLYQAP